MEKLRHFLKEGKWKQLKKSDLVVIALIGVLLLIIAIPSGNGTKNNTEMPGESDEEAEREGNASVEPSFGGNEDDYIAYLEKRLKTILSGMEGVGKVEVMITVSDSGENVVEKDSVDRSTVTSETDSSGGSRTVTEGEREENTIYVEKGSETYPYIQKEKMPTIEGIVVVAEGGGNVKVISDISDALEALFSVEAHKIKVVRMGSKEE